MVDFTRKQKSLIRQARDRDLEERRYSELTASGMTADQVKEALGQSPGILDGGVLDFIDNLILADDRTEFNEVPELSDRNTWEAMGGDPDAVVYGGGDSKYTPRMSAQAAAGKFLTEDDYQLKGVMSEALGSNADFWSDRHGNTVVTIDGQDFYLNKPGLSKLDVERLASQLINYSAGSRFYNYGNILKRMLGSAIAFTGIAAARDVGQWTIGGPTPEADRAVVIGGLGALGVPVMALGGLVGKAAWQKAKGWFKGGSLSDEAIRELERAGISVDEVEGPMRKWFNVMESKHGVQAAVAAAVEQKLPSELNVPLTAGEKTQLTATQQQETILAGGARGAAAQRVAEQQRAAQKEALESAVDDLGGNAQRGTSLAATTEQLGGMSAIDYQAMKMAFGDAETSFAALPQVERQTMRNKIGFISEGGNLEGTNAYGVHMLALDDLLSGATKARPGLPGAPKPEGAWSGPSVGSLYKWRSEVSKAAHLTSDNTERYALERMVNNFDDYMDDLIERGSVLGNPNNIRFWKEAVDLRRKFGKDWQATKIEDPNFLVSKLVDNQGRIKYAPDEAANIILNTADVGWIGKPMLNRSLIEIKRRLGDMSAGWRGIRDEVVLRLIQNARNRAGDFSPKKMLGTWYKLKQNNPNLLNTIFDIEDQRLIGRFLYNAARIMKKTPMGSNPPNTAIFQKILGRVANIPGINVLTDFGAESQAARLFSGKIPQPPGRPMPKIEAPAVVAAEPEVQQRYPNLGPGAVGLLAQPFMGEGNLGGTGGSGLK